MSSIERRLAAVPRNSASELLAAALSTSVGASTLETIMTSANNPYVNPKSDERLVMQVKALPPEAAKSVLIRLAQGLPSDTVGRALSSALAMHAVMPPTAAPAAPAGPLGKDKGWAEMSASDERKAAGALGYDEASWEEGLVPEACTKRWETLEGTVKAAAVSLGYTQEEWDAELEPAADAARRRQWTG